MDDGTSKSCDSTRVMQFILLLSYQLVWHTHTAKLLEQITKAQSLEMGQGDNIIYIYLIQVSLCRHVWCHIYSAVPK